MASLAHVEHSSQRYVKQGAEIAPGHARMSCVIDKAMAFAKRFIAQIGPSIEKWSEAHHQAVKDRIFWELALSDRAVMEELRALQARSPRAGGGE